MIKNKMLKKTAWNEVGDDILGKIEEFYSEFTFYAYKKKLFELYNPVIKCLIYTYENVVLVYYVRHLDYLNVYACNRVFKSIIMTFHLNLKGAVFWTHNIRSMDIDQLKKWLKENNRFEITLR